MADFKNVKKQISELPKASKEIAERLLAKAVFMDEKLEELQKSLKGKPLVEEYNNGGGQSGMKESTEIKIYNATIKNYSTVMKQIFTIIEESDQSTHTDEFAEFCK